MTWVDGVTKTRLKQGSMHLLLFLAFFFFFCQENVSQIFVVMVLVCFHLLVLFFSLFSGFVI